MGQRGLWVIAAAVLIAGLGGCANKETEALRAKVGQIEKDLVDLRTHTEENAAALSELKSRVEQAQSSVNGLTAQLVRVKVERDKLKQEVVALRKKRR